MTLLKAGAITVAVTLAALPARLGAQTPDYYPADYAAMVEASRAENGVLLYSNSSTDDWQPVFDAFNETYPWIRINNLDLGSTEVIERHLAEIGTGSSSADLLITGAPDGFLRLLDRGAVAGYASPEDPHLPGFAKPSSGLYTIAIDPLLLVWNKMTVPEDQIPTGVADLAAKIQAHPETFDDKVVTYSAETNAYGYWSAYALVKHYGDDAWGWLTTIGQAARLENSVGPSLEKLIAGEYNVMIFAASGGTWLRARDPQLSRIVGWSFISDGNPVMVRGAAIAESASNPNSARLLLDFLLSERGQIELAKAARTPVRLGLTPEMTGGFETFESIAQLIGEDLVMVAEYDPAIFAERETFLAQWQKAFTNK